MGKAWDKSVPSVAVWEQCLRILKPGGHIVAFAGTRTQHRMACAIEDAGFQVRDMLAWCYASGFPKSTDMTQSMEKFQAGVSLGTATTPIDPAVYRCTEFLRNARNKAGWTNKRIDELFGTNGMAGHWTTSKSQPAVPSWNQWLQLKQCLGFDNSCDELVQQLGAIERPDDWGSSAGNEERFLATLNEVGNSQTWGTGLKPSLEPITLARKPFTGTNSANVQQYGTGALHLQACRISADDQTRWPPNLLVDGSPEVDQALSQKSRVFYCGKARPKDRDEGCEDMPLQKSGSLSGSDDGSLNSIPLKRNVHPTVKPTDVMRWLCRLVTPPGGLICDPFMGSGSTGKAAILEGFRFVGCDLDPQFVKIARARISYASKSLRRGKPETAA